MGNVRGKTRYAAFDVMPVAARCANCIVATGRAACGSVGWAEVTLPIAIDPSKSGSSREEEGKEKTILPLGIGRCRLHIGCKGDAT